MKERTCTLGIPEEQGSKLFKDIIEENFFWMKEIPGSTE